MSTTRREIKNGPSRDRLFDALKFAYEDGVKLPVQFGVVAGYSAPIDDPRCMTLYAGIKNLRITSLEYEDGSGESFNIKGYCDSDIEGGFSNYRHYKFNAYYNSHDRQGSMEFIHA